eukprot:4474294-Amphidinium_carterae.1
MATCAELPEANDAEHDPAALGPEVAFRHAATRRVDVPHCRCNHAHLFIRQFQILKQRCSI